MNDLPAIFRALADPTRLRIVRLLGQMELAVGEVVHVLAQSQPRISRHVRILAESGLVERHKEGAWVFLRPGPVLADSPLGEFLAPGDRDDPVYAADALALEKVRDARGEAAQRWFADHAAEWDELRALHISEQEVESAIRALVGDGPLDTLLDIGTGTGRMVELLGGQAGRAIAVDNSPDMLRIARAKLSSGNGADGDEGVPVAVDLRHSGFTELPLDDRSCDLAIMHQALHYAPEPAPVVAEAARVLRPGGRLLIADFAPHDREELRANHAHARLGFDDDSMAEWFGQAGLALDDVRTLHGGELTVKLWLGHKTQDTPKAIRKATQ